MLCQPIESPRVLLTNEQLANFETFDKMISNDPVDKFNKTMLNKITSNLNKMFSSLKTTSSLEPYPNTLERVNRGQISPSEIAEFLAEFFYDENEFYVYTGNLTYPVNPGEVESILLNYEYFLNRNMASALTGSFCSAFGNVFEKLSGLLVLASGAATLVSQLSNFSLASVMTMLTGIKDKLLSLVDNLAGNLINQVKSMVRNMVPQLKQLTANSESLFRIINQKAGQVMEFFSDLNIKTIKEKVESLIAKMAGLFEEITPDVLALLLFRLCQIAETIQNFMQNPVDAFNNILNDMVSRVTGLQVMTSTNAQRIINNGGVYIDIPTRGKIQQRVAADVNRSSASGASSGQYNTAPGRYVTLPISDEEMAWVQGLTSAGDNHIKFADSVVNMGSNAKSYHDAMPGRGPWCEDQNFPDAGWKYIVNTNPFIFAALKRVSIRLGKQLTLNSCFRSPYYNWYLKNVKGDSAVATSSKHTMAQACDVSTRNMSDDETALLVKYASQEGFNRLSVYGTFVHVDIGAGSYRGNWTHNYRGNANIQRSVELHLTRQHTHG